MDIINVLVSGEDKSGTSTFANTLKLTKFSPYILNISENGTNEELPLSNYDIVFYVMNINSEIDKQYHVEYNQCYLEYLISNSNINQCLFVPIFNKLDLYDFNVDDKTGKVTPSDEINELMDIKLTKLYNMCDQLGDNFVNEKIICSAELAYMYIYLSTCTKATANSDPTIISKIGKYELGKLQWNKKTAIEKSNYAQTLVELLKKQNKLTITLNSVGYNIQSVIKKYITEKMLFYMVQKHLTIFHNKFNSIKTTEKIIDVLKYITDKFKCVTDHTNLSDYETLTIINDISNYINSYDYISLDFHEKSEILNYFRNTESKLFDDIDINSNINFLTAILSQEIGMQLGSCETFVELVDKLYDCLDINNDIFIDQILLNHKTFKMLLFSSDLNTNIEYALSKFDLDLKSFFLQIMEMKLTAILSSNDHIGMVESMMCVEEFLNVKHDLISAVPLLTKYKILLKYALSKTKCLCDKELLINKIDDENTLYVENIYYDLIFNTKENDTTETSDTSEEIETVEEIDEENISKSAKNIKNKIK